MLTNLYCRTCRDRKPHVISTPNHVLHLLLSIVTGGIWLPMWALCGLGLNRRVNCQACGSKYQSFLDVAGRYAALAVMASLAILLIFLLTRR